MPRKSLSDILRNGDRESLSRAWGETKPAEDFAPLPPGEYVAHIVGGELSAGKTKGTPGYKLVFRVIEGDHQGRQFWDHIWLTPAALPMAKRDLGKLGVTALEQLETSLPPGIRCRVKLALRKEDDGTEHNRVKCFEVVGIDEPEQDAFAPQDGPHPDPLPKGEGTGGKPLPKGEGTIALSQDAPGPAPEPQAADGSAGGGNVPF